MRGEYGIGCYAYQGSLRFTPTCVGNTRRSSILAIYTSVHPHMRGEYAPQPMSSYLVRRFTPTCVGNTRAKEPKACHEPVHPHMRGEYCRMAGLAVLVTVHPHMRGEYAVPGYGSRPLSRFTPTCVGNTYLNHRVERKPRFTPTCVGNTVARFDEIRSYTGSPPHAWGIQRKAANTIEPLRFTPTCVGNTALAGRSTHGYTVHPHMRGEYGSHLELNHAEARSHPHNAWGIP